MSDFFIFFLILIVYICETLKTLFRNYLTIYRYV